MVDHVALLASGERHVGFESRKAWARRWHGGFWQRYASGPNILDIGSRGGTPDALPIVPQAIAVELDYPGYDGIRLPFPDMSQDAVHSSHVLEHLPDRAATLREWFRVLKLGGHMILFVPHAYLYERRLSVPPSRWSGEHLCCFTPSSLLACVERALQPNSYRVREFHDDDTGYDYGLPPTQHPVGCLEMCLVLQRIAPPAWDVEA